MLLRKSGDGRYVQVHKSFHLCFSPTNQSGASAGCWPQRSSDIFDSLFLSRKHMLDLMQAHNIDGDPMRSAQVTAWSIQLRKRMADAFERGSMYQASIAVLLREFMDAQQPSLPGVVRLLQSEAARFNELSRLNQCLCGVLRCTGIEDHRVKCDIGLAAKMFDSYRVQVIRLLSSDACCNFEALRFTIQSDFAALFSHIRDQGVLTAYACAVLAAVDNALECVLLSVSSQIVQNIPSVKRALQDHAASSGGGGVDLN